MSQIRDLDVFDAISINNGRVGFGQVSNECFSILINFNDCLMLRYLRQLDTDIRLLVSIDEWLIR